MVERITDEREVEAWLYPRGERAPHVRNVDQLPLHPDPYQDDDAHQVVGYGADDGPQVGEYVVELRLPLVGHEHPEHDAHREADNERRANTEERPWQVGHDDLTYGYAARDERLTEVSSRQVAQILKVLLVDRRVQVEREQRGGLRLRVLVRQVVLGDQVGYVSLNRAAGHEPDQEERQRGHDEDGYERLDYPAKQVTRS